MKQLLVALALLLSLGMTARDRLYIKSFQIQSGNTVELPVYLDNDTAYCAFQTDLHLPDGLVVEKEDGEYVVDLTSRVSSRTHAVSTALLSDGSIRIFVSSQSVKTISGNSGAVLNVLVKATKDLANSPVELRNSIAVEENGQKHDLDKCVVWAGSGSAMRGDVNGDGAVDVDDLNIVINIMVRKASFAQWPAADLDANGVVDVDDLNHVINIMIRKE